MNYRRKTSFDLKSEITETKFGAYMYIIQGDYRHKNKMGCGGGGIFLDDGLKEYYVLYGFE